MKESGYILSSTFNDILYQPDPDLSAEFEKNFMGTITRENIASGFNSGMYLASTTAFSYGTAHAILEYQDKPEYAAGLAALTLVSAYNALASVRDVRYTRAVDFTKGLALSTALSASLYNVVIPDDKTEEKIEAVSGYTIQIEQPDHDISQGPDIE